jgi:predicted SAM-dependent methyltransferase
MDFLVSVHSLEHFRHPLLVVPEWIRALRPGGRLAIVVPDYRYTFSCRDPNQAGRGKGEAHLRDYTLTSLCVDMAQFWELEIIDARIVCPQFSVGVILEKTLNG